VSGIKETPMGFYANRIGPDGKPSVPQRPGVKDATKPDEGGRVEKDAGHIQTFIGFPGALNSEFRRNPEVFNKAAVSFEMPITSAQKDAVFSEVNNWNNHPFQSTNMNCVDFVARVGLGVQ
jgi:hypothetical protein